MVGGSLSSKQAKKTKYQTHIKYVLHIDNASSEWNKWYIVHMCQTTILYLKKMSNALTYSKGYLNLLVRLHLEMSSQKVWNARRLGFGISDIIPYLIFLNFKVFQTLFKMLVINLYNKIFLRLHLQLQETIICSSSFLFFFLLLLYVLTIYSSGELGAIGGTVIYSIDLYAYAYCIVMSWFKQERSKH